ncbi:MAG: PTS ascorbate transporter subunit IIC, partial [Cryobacterium sp.]|nr:PTS ascorbate transporter subunit IIC [Cryobacterium sp.]
FLGAFVNGIIITILPAFLMLVMGAVLGAGNTTFGDADFGWFGILIGSSLLTGNTVIGVILTIVIAVVLVVAAWAWQVRVVNKGWIPGAARAAEMEKLDADEAAAAKAAKADS